MTKFICPVCSQIFFLILYKSSQFIKNPVNNNNNNNSAFL